MRTALFLIGALILIRDTTTSESQTLSPAEYTMVNAPEIHQPDEAFEISTPGSFPVAAGEKQFIALKDLPEERRLSIRVGTPHGADLEPPLRTIEDSARIAFSSPVSPDAEIQIQKPWLARPIAGTPKSAHGYCPTGFSNGLRQFRQEEREKIAWPYEHTEVRRDGDFEERITNTRNLGYFYALLDPESGMYATLEKSEYMPWRADIQQNEIDALCTKALEGKSRINRWEFGQDANGTGIARLVQEEGPSFLDHQPVDVKTACPGGGRDTFAATYGVFFRLEKREARIVGKGMTGQVISDLVCRVETQICCFESEAPWPLHSFYPGESGKGYDNPNPYFSPSAEQLETWGRMNYAYSFLGSKGLSRDMLEPQDLALPSYSGLRDPWLKRLAPVTQPPKGKFPSLDTAVVRTFDLNLDIGIPPVNP